MFADKDLEQRFLVRRYRRSDVSARLLGAWARPAPIKPKRERGPAVTPRVAEPDPLLERLWKRALDLGRYPEDSELEELPALIEAHGSLGRALRRMQKSHDQALLERAQVARTDDLRLYFAVMQFSKRPRYRHLEAGLQRDVKAFFSDYANAQAAGLRLLGQAADPAVILAACKEASKKGLGWLDRDHSLQTHVSLIDRLPPVLRAFVSCGLVVYGLSSATCAGGGVVGSGARFNIERIAQDGVKVPAVAFDLCAMLEAQMRAAAIGAPEESPSKA